MNFEKVPGSSEGSSSEELIEKGGEVTIGAGGLEQEDKEQKMLNLQSEALDFVKGEGGTILWNIINFPKGKMREIVGVKDKSVVSKLYGFVYKGLNFSESVDSQEFLAEKYPQFDELKFAYEKLKEIVQINGVSDENDRKTLDVANQVGDKCLEFIDRRIEHYRATLDQRIEEFISEYMKDLRFDYSIQLDDATRKTIENEIRAYFESSEFKNKMERKLEGISGRNIQIRMQPSLVFESIDEMEGFFKVNHFQSDKVHQKEFPEYLKSLINPLAFDNFTEEKSEKVE